MRASLIPILLAGAASAALLADEPDPAKRAADVKAALDKVAHLVGDWAAQETYAPSPVMPKGGNVIGQTKTIKVVGGHYLQARHTSASKHEALGMWGYDPGSGQYTLDWYDPMGVARYRGRLADKVLTMAHQAGEASWNLVFTFHDKDHHTLELSKQQGEKKTVLLTSEVTRKGAGPRMVKFKCQACPKTKEKALGQPAPSC